jgi:DNA polymerase elongation subunit (family B)
MIKKEDLKNILYFDVESAGQYPSYEEMELQNPRLAKLWAKRAKYFRDNSPEMDKLSDADIYLHKAGMEAEFGRVICVSFGLIGDDGKTRFTSFFGEDEKDILVKSNKILSNAAAKGMKICGHNIKSFDIPFLGKKMLYNGIPPSSNLQIWDKKPWEVAILDTAELFSFGSWSHKYLGLDLLACSLGIESPKEDIEGSKVHGVFWKEKSLERIKDYCERDVDTVIKVLTKISV